MPFECELALVLEMNADDLVDKHFLATPILVGHVFVASRPHLAEYLSISFFEPQTQAQYSVTCTVVQVEQAVVTHIQKAGVVRVTGQVPKTEGNWLRLLNYLLAVEEAKGQHHEHQ